MKAGLVPGVWYDDKAYCITLYQDEKVFHTFYDLISISLMDNDIQTIVVCGT